MPATAPQSNKGGTAWTFENPSSVQITDGSQPQHAPTSRSRRGDSASIQITSAPGIVPMHYDAQDLYQDQHWADLPTAQHAQPILDTTSLLPPNNTWDRSFDISYTPEEDFPGEPEGRQTARQDFHVPMSVPALATHRQNSSEGGKALRAHSQSKRPGPTIASEPRASITVSENQSSTLTASSAGRGEGSRGLMNKGAGTRMPLGARVAAREEDIVGARSGQNISGESMRSTTSNYSYGEEHIAKSDSADDDTRSAATRPFILRNQGIGQPASILRSRQFDENQDGQAMLPAEKGFPIQIGSELFRLSGASIRSDAPSYFSKFFEEQLRQSDDSSGGVKTLYIDRDPGTFQDICRHLQGYHVQPRDGSHYVRLFADAQFYSLPRLISQLFDSEIFIEIGGQNFQIPRDLFSSPGDSPNFFSLGFAAFFSSPNEVFPGLEREGLLRPPSILPPSVPNRSAHTFAELLHLLRGYPLHIRNNEHRAELLRDCRYFHLRGLEQRLIQHHISFNVERNKSEVIIRLEDIRQSGVSFVGDASPSDRSPLGGWVNYARPFVDETTSELIVEVRDESTKIDFRSMRADFHGDSRARITSLFQVVANKMNLPTNVPLGLMMSSGGASAQPVSPGNTPLSEDRVKVRIERDAHIILDGEEYVRDSIGFDHYDASATVEAMLEVGRTSSVPLSVATTSWPPTDQHPSPQISRPSSTIQPPRKRKRKGSLDEFGEWIIRKGQWRLRVQPRLDQNAEGMEIVLHAVKLDAVSGQKGRNTLREFLT